MRKLLWIGLFGSVAMLFGADTAKADHCYGGGFGGYSSFGLYGRSYSTYSVAPNFGVYNYGYSPNYYSGYSPGYYSPYYGGSGLSISIGRGGYFGGGRSFYGGRSFGGRGFGGHHHHHHH